MIIQYIIIATIVAACIVYAAIRFYQTWKKARKCHDFHCSGCAFYEKCKNNQKKLAKNLVE